MLIECQNCGAPLNIIGNERIATCTYCGRQNMVQQTRMMAAQTPPGWQPPAQWTPPQHFPERSVPLQLRAPPGYAQPGGVPQQPGGFPQQPRIPQPMQQQRSGGGMALALAGGVAALIAVGSIVPFVMMRSSDTGGGSDMPGAGMLGGGDKVSNWDGTSTLSCDTNEKLVIEKKDATVLDGPAIRAGMNCKIEIRDSTLIGRTGIDGNTNTEITLVNSTIHGKEVGIRGAHNLKVDARKNSKVSGKEQGIVADANAKIQLRDSSVSSDEVAIEAGHAINLEARNSTISGKQTALKSGMGGSATLISSKLEGAKQLGMGTKFSER